MYWDEALESFGLRVYPSGRRVYVCAYRVNQRKRLATLGRADALSLDQARKKAMTYLAKAANHEDPQSNIDAQRQLKTIDELVEAYIEGHAKKKKKTWKEDQSSLKRHVLSKLSGRLAVSLVTADIEAIHSQLGVEHPYGANNLLKVVRKMFNWGKVAGLVPEGSPQPRRRHRPIPGADAQAVRHDRRDAALATGPRTGRQRLCSARHLAPAAHGPALQGTAQSQMGGH